MKAYANEGNEREGTAEYSGGIRKKRKSSGADRRESGEGAGDNFKMEAPTPAPAAPAPAPVYGPKTAEDTMVDKDVTVDQYREAVAAATESRPENRYTKDEMAQKSLEMFDKNIIKPKTDGVGISGVASGASAGLAVGGVVGAAVGATASAAVDLFKAKKIEDAFSKKAIATAVLAAKYNPDMKESLAESLRDAGVNVSNTDFAEFVDVAPDAEKLREIETQERNRKPAPENVGQVAATNTASEPAPVEPPKPTEQELQQARFEKLLMGIDASYRDFDVNRYAKESAHVDSMNALFESMGIAGKIAKPKPPKFVITPTSAVESGQTEARQPVGPVVGTPFSNETDALTRPTEYINPNAPKQQPQPITPIAAQTPVRQETSEDKPYATREGSMSLTAQPEVKDVTNNMVIRLLDAGFPLEAILKAKNSGTLDNLAKSGVRV